MIDNSLSVLAKRCGRRVLSLGKAATLPRSRGGLGHLIQICAKSLASPYRRAYGRCGPMLLRVPNKARESDRVTRGIFAGFEAKGSRQTGLMPTFARG